MSGLALLTLAAEASAQSETLQQSLLRWLKLESPWELWWIAFGLLGQFVFTVRWLIQWWASEKRRSSHVPVAFWWCSIVGGMMMLIYFTVRFEPVGFLGQLFGVAVYGRNLWLIKIRHREVGAVES